MQESSSSDTGRTTRLLSRAREGDEAARDEVLRRTEGSLRAIARGHLSRYRLGHRKGATSLVHDAILKLLRNSRLDAINREQFLGLMKLAMHSELVDFVRRETSLSNGGGHVRVPVFELASPNRVLRATREELEESLRELEAFDEQAARVFILITVYGCSIRAASSILELTLSAGKRNWEFSRSWLARSLAQRLGEGL